MATRYFAVGAAKGWVQIRSAKKPPVPETTETVTTVRERRHMWDENEFDYVERYIPRKMKMRVTVFNGGRTIMTIKASRFSRLLRASVRADGIIELMPKQVELLEERE